LLAVVVVAQVAQLPLDLALVVVAQAD